MAVILVMLNTNKQTKQTLWPTIEKAGAAAACVSSSCGCICV
jgi:hypothetical protein